MSSGKRILRELPIDIVEEILLRLPGEHVMRCKLLSKTYYDLIGKADFIDRHHLHHQQSGDINIAVMFRAGNTEYHSLNLLRPNNTDVKTYVFKPPGKHRLLEHDKAIVGSCNGLLCVQLTARSSYRSYTLWNPTTGEILKIPKPKLKLTQRPYTYRYNTVGFGYNSSGDYKFVLIGRDHSYPSGAPYSAVVWSLRTNKWKEIGCVLPRLQSHRGHPGLFIGSNLYWLATSWRRKGDHRVILFSFDMNNDTFREVTMPDEFLLCPYDPYHKMEINNFMGALALFIQLSASTGDTLVYKVWVMNEDHSNNNSLPSSFSWTKKLSITTIAPFVIPTAVSINGNFVMRKGLRLCSYDPHQHKQVETEYESYEIYYDKILWCFTGSLVSMKEQRLKKKQSKRKRSRQDNPRLGRNKNISPLVAVSS